MGMTVYASGTFTPTSKSIVSSTNATPISVKVTGHGLTTGDRVYIANHATNTNANGLWTITTAGADDFTLDGSVGNGVGGATGTALTANETIVSSVNVAGEFYFVVDCVNMAAGDSVLIQVYQILLTGGTARVVAVAGFQGAQPTHDVIKHSVAFANELTDSNSLRLGLAQITGTQQSFNWKILRATVPPQGVEKNVALANFEFAMFDDLGNLKTGLTSFTSQYSLDGAAFASLSGTVSAVSNGIYKIDSISAAELNGNVITLRFAASGARDKMITILTVTR
jgi:hypothetical protein